MKNMRIKSSVVTILCAIMMIGLNATVSFAQIPSEYKNLISRFLGAAETKVKEDGYQKAYSSTFGSLRNGDLGSFSVEMQAGRQYKIIGVCDQDCSDLDTRLLDSNGRELVKDVLADDIPILDFIPERSGKYKVEIKMIKCADTPCYYGVDVYNKAGSTSNNSSGNPLRDRLIKQIHDQLNQIGARLSDSDGYREVLNPMVNTIRNGESTTFEVALNRGMSYRLIGVCDEDCSDIDIKVFDSGNRLMISDTTVGDLANVSFQPNQTGVYKVQLVMARCTKNPCMSGIGVWGK